MTNVDKLRDDIDRGRTGDKVDVSDPAAAPLGTDDEAAGTPVTAARAAIAHASSRSAGQSHAGPRQDRFPLGWMAIVAVALLTAAAALGGMFLI